MTQDNTDRLLSRKEVEERFGISKRFLELAMAKREGPRAIHIGRLVRYRVTDVAAWIETNASQEVK